MNFNIIAKKLDDAVLDARSVPQISKSYPITIKEAYAIQRISLARRYLRGEKLMGIKLGFTSRAKMEQMGVHDVIWGRLTDEMANMHEDMIFKSDFIHPRAEPEIAFLVGKEISEEVSLDSIKNYVKAVAVAIEIIDSRYENFKFSLEDVIADNCSSAGYAIGQWKSVDTNIVDIPMALLIDEKAIHEGNSNAILGNPWESMVAAARFAKKNGEILRQGSIVLAGAATPASFIEIGQEISARAEGLGSVSLKVI